jgi:hypothetical protein
MSESPIFVRTHDLLLWLLPAIDRLPRSQRPVLGRAIQEAALAFQQHITEAVIASDNTALQRADVALALLRSRLRLCYELRFLAIGQYEHVSRMLTEIGKLLGGWQRHLQRTGTP